MADFSTSATTIQQVSDRIEQVEKVYKSALSKVEGGIFGQSEGERGAETSIKALKGNIDDWSARGRSASKVSEREAIAKGYLHVKGWKGWTNAGDIYKTNINAIADTGDHATLAAVVATVKDAPATSAKAIKDAAKQVEEAAIDAGGAAAMAVLKPLGVGLAVYIAFRIFTR